MFPLPAPPASSVAWPSWRSNSGLPGERVLAEEVPVAFSCDGATHAILMAIPDDIEDFALGFSLTEGIIVAPAEIDELDVVCTADGIIVRIWLAAGRSDAFA
ncbi:MAG: formate dehydrogenase accessory sulfurtransferase FdhD, partial [Alphaproteobacteria bacterium]|nr:formate dehydrogenase accessory sulfurtransferase FdhD [Alphaproteobacteria bacterium]